MFIPSPSVREIAIGHEICLTDNRSTTTHLTLSVTNNAATTTTAYNNNNYYYYYYVLLHHCYNCLVTNINHFRSSERIFSQQALESKCYSDCEHSVCVGKSIPACACCVCVCS